MRYAILSTLVTCFFSPFFTTAQENGRFYYDYSKKTMFKKQDLTDEKHTPIGVKAGKDVRIVIKKFNPLRNELLINDTSYNRFMIDADKFSALIVVPTINKIGPATGSGDKNFSIDFTQGVEMLMSDLNMKSRGNKKPGKINPKLMSCDIIDNYSMVLYQINDEMITNIAAYKDFSKKVEFINKKLANFKLLKVLEPAHVTNQLNDYLIQVNTAAPDELTVDIFKISGQDILNNEELLYKPVEEGIRLLRELKKSVDNIKKDDCKEYIDKYKIFTDAFSALKKAIEDFTEARNDKGLPAMMSNTSLYDQLIQYAMQEPEEITYARTIESDRHTIYLYEKEPGKEKKLYDVINIEPKSGWKIDFAGGIFFSGLNDKNYTKTSVDSFIQKNYIVGGTPGGEVRDTLISQTYTHLHERKQMKLSFGAMIYMHYHTRSQGDLNGGVYLGFGALFNDQTRLTIGAGGSLIIGKSQRFALNLGAVMAQVERLDPPYQTKTLFTGKLDNIPTYKKWELQPSLGFSWNFK